MGENNSKITRFDDFGRGSSLNRYRTSHSTKYLGNRRQGLNKSLKSKNFNSRQIQDEKLAFAYPENHLEQAERYQYEVKRMEIDKSLKFCNNFLKNVTNIKNNVCVTQVSHLIGKQLEDAPKPRFKRFARIQAMEDLNRQKTNLAIRKIRVREFGAKCDFEMAKLALQRESVPKSRSESPHSRYTKSQIRNYLRKTPSAHSVNSKIDESPCFPQNNSSLAPSHKEKSENSNKKNISGQKNHFFSFNGKDLITSFSGNAHGNVRNKLKKQTKPKLLGKENLYFKPLECQPYGLITNQNQIQEVDEDFQTITHNNSVNRESLKSLVQQASQEIENEKLRSYHKGTFGTINSKNSKNSGNLESSQEKKKVTAFEYYQSLLNKGRDKNILYKSGNIQRVVSLPKKLKKEYKSTIGLDLRKSQSKKELFSRKKGPELAEFSPQPVLKHFPRPSAEFRYHQEVSEGDRSSVGNDVMVNGIIIENSAQFSNFNFQKAPEPVHQVQTFKLDTQESQALLVKKAATPKKLRCKEIEDKKSALKRKAIKNMQRSKKGRWREMLSSGKKKFQNKTMRASNKKSVSKKDLTPSKSNRKSSKRLNSSGKKLSTVKKSSKKSGRESINSKSKKLAKEMILKSFRKKTQESFMTKANCNSRAYKTMGNSSDKKTKITKIDLKNMKILKELASKKNYSQSKNDYFFQRMLSTNSNQTLPANQSSQHTDTLNSNLHVESIFTNQFSSQQRDSLEGQIGSSKKRMASKRASNYLDATSSYITRDAHGIGFRTNISQNPMNHQQLKKLMQEKNQNLLINNHLKEGKSSRGRIQSQMGSGVPFRVNSKLGISSFDVSQSKKSKSNLKKKKRVSRLPLQNIMARHKNSAPIRGKYRSFDARTEIPNHPNSNRDSSQRKRNLGSSTNGINSSRGYLAKYKQKRKNASASYARTGIRKSKSSQLKKTKNVNHRESLVPECTNVTPTPYPQSRGHIMQTKPMKIKNFNFDSLMKDSIKNQNKFHKFNQLESQSKQSDLLQMDSKLHDWDRLSEDKDLAEEWNSLGTTGTVGNKKSNAYRGTSIKPNMKQYLTTDKLKDTIYKESKDTVDDSMAQNSSSLHFNPQHPQKKSALQLRKNVFNFGSNARMRNQMMDNKKSSSSRIMQQMRLRSGINSDRSHSNKENNAAVMNFKKHSGHFSARNLTRGLERMANSRLKTSYSKGNICKLKIDITNLSSKALGSISSKHRQTLTLARYLTKT